MSEQRGCCSVHSISSALFGVRILEESHRFVSVVSAVFTATAPLGSALLTVQEKGEGKFWKIARLAYITAIMFGLLISNTRAVIEGLVGVKSSFYRTPKNGDN